MDREKEATLIARFPWLYGNPDREADLAAYGRAWDTCLIDNGFGCGDGWYGIIERLSERLDAVRLETGEAFHAVQVKEKFGTLRVSLSGVRSYPALSMVDAAMSEAQQEALRTCELCGAPADTSDLPVLGTFCRKHALEESIRQGEDWED